MSLPAPRSSVSSEKRRDAKSQRRLLLLQRAAVLAQPEEPAGFLNCPRPSGEGESPQPIQVSGFPKRPIIAEVGAAKDRVAPSEKRLVGKARANGSQVRQAPRAGSPGGCHGDGGEQREPAHHMQVCRCSAGEGDWRKARV